MNKSRHAFWAAALLMATSAIGPGFLTQTTVFTQQLLAGFSCIILLSILVDMVVQLNIWRILFARKQTASEVADELMPGLGKLLSILIALGGFAFNLGNIAGTGLGLETLTGIPNKIGAAISVGLVVLLLINKEKALPWMDRTVTFMGFLMLAMTCYVAIASKPPLKSVLIETFWPSRFDYRALLTIVGGTVGGYICFAGAHRMLEAAKKENITMQTVSSSAGTGILTASIMRYLLFLAALGVFSRGLSMESDNPAADVFGQAAGPVGFRLFGIVMWCAAITSVMGSAYTTISFAKPYIPWLQRQPEKGTIAFIALSAICFFIWGKPVQLLLAAGLINGFILPVSLIILLLAIRKNKNGYQHPLFLRITGWLIAAILTWMAIQVLLQN
jgi:Mn2+/Fe2+ NRAMP family transporter